MFRIQSEFDAITKSQPFDSFEHLYEALIKPLNRFTQQSLGNSNDLLYLEADANFVYVKCKYIGCHVVYYFMRVKKSELAEVWGTVSTSKDHPRLPENEECEDRDMCLKYLKHR